MSLGMITRASAFILAVASIAFTSCKKDKSNPGNPGNQTKKISRIEENGITTATFEYNTDGTLKKVSTTYDSPNTVTFTFSYDSQKRPVEFVSDEGHKSKYVYENNLLTRTENFNGVQKISENVFQYENGKIKSNTYFTAYPQGGGNVLYKPTYRAVYHYYPNGAVQKISTYILNPLTNDLELMFEYAYQQYDNKKNPLSVMADFSQVLMYQPVNINNPLSERMYNPDGSVAETTENVYTYDAAGYPVTCRATITSAGETPTINNLKFFY